MSELIYTGNQLPSKHMSNFDEMLTKVLRKPQKDFPHTQRITRDHPTSFVFLIDQSYSMNQYASGSDETTMAEFLANVINQTLNEMIDRCKKGTELRDYFHICLIGYGGDEDDTAKILWEGNLSGKVFVTPSELIDNYLGKSTTFVESKRPDGSVKQIEKTVFEWVEPKSVFRTPMLQAFRLAHDLLVQWIHEHPESYPPTVINITDGMATDGSPDELLDAANSLRELHTEDGNVLVFNIHTSNSADNSVFFPCTKSELVEQDEYAALLFDMSSDLPSNYNKHISNFTKKDIVGAYTAMVVNAPISKMISLLNVGTNTNAIKHS